MENVAGEQGLALQQLFHTNLLTLSKIQAVINSHSLMMGASNFDIDMLFPFLPFVKL